MLEPSTACFTAQQHSQSQCHARTFVRCTHGDEVSPDLEGVFREPGSSTAASLQPVPAEQPAATCQALEVLQAALLTSPLCIHLHRTCHNREARGVIKSQVMSEGMTALRETNRRVHEKGAQMGMQCRATLQVMAQASIWVGHQDGVGVLTLLLLVQNYKVLRCQGSNRVHWDGDAWPKA